MIALKETPTETTASPIEAGVAGVAKEPEKVEPKESDPKSPVDPKIPEMDASAPPAKATEEAKKVEPEVPAPPVPINGVIVYKAEIKYGEGSDKQITEYWFYVRKFDTSKTS